MINNNKFRFDWWDSWKDTNPADWWKNWAELWDPANYGFTTMKPIFSRERPPHVEKDLCTVLIPFHEPFLKLYKECIKPPLEEAGLRVEIADNIFIEKQDSQTLSTGISTSLSQPYIASSQVGANGFNNIKVRSVIEDIWRLINRSGILIADATSKNANVFYELGIAHTIGKAVIIITQKQEDVPFDVAHLRYFKYSNNDKGKRELREYLTNVTKQIL